MSAFKTVDQIRQQVAASDDTSRRPPEGRSSEHTFCAGDSRGQVVIPRGYGRYSGVIPSP